MLQVYRVETAKGEGPYGDVGRKHIDFDSYRQPPPFNDGLGDDHEGQHFGFASLDQLKAWFHSHEREKLAAVGFHISVYNVEARREGKRQVTFKRDARRRKRKPLPLTAI